MIATSQQDLEGQREETRSHLLQAEAASLGVFLALSALSPRLVRQSEAERIARDLRESVSQAAYRSAQLGRQYGIRSLTAQFGIRLQGTDAMGRAADAARATRLGDRLAGSWLKKLAPANDGGSLLTPPKIVGRLSSIATTETALAFDSERVAVARSQLAPNYDLIETWDATLDRRTCSFCASMHGETAGRSGFSGGQRPGGVHPRCRCVSQFELRNIGAFDALPYIAAGATYGWM